MARIILFDGVCNLCNSSVQFIMKRDPLAKFQFASLQSEIGQKLLRQHGFNQELNSFVLIENDKVFIKSNAALRVCMNLKGLWRYLSIFRIIPPAIRDYIYVIIAKNRYKWFGKQETCMLPTPDMKRRFLD
jgi:predicted DCC family thiol-disulfide oxidoreductase YuxK